MNLSIRPLNKLTHQHYELLLDADPSEGVINNYMQRAVSFEAVNNNELLGIVVLLPTRPETLEIVNISVTATKRNNGIGRQLLTFAENMLEKTNTLGLKSELGPLALVNFICIKNVVFE
ncbi:GNAT family N-acetyltransferase [Lentilactobacillus kosonis]|uniref:Acetyltransferase, GNAT family n=1 Tax=Lentilactobacillus kosonis TaxID=2810561 RepID=A0A401FKA7_9LACO|nr:acetyltransferase, GNAT family [Lentilactobacillus kosonis]